MQRETTNQDFPVNFRGIALTGQHRSIAMTQVMQKKRKICTQKSQNLNILHQILSSQYVTKKITLIVLLSHLFASQVGLAMITLPPSVNCFLSLCQGRPYLLSLSPPSPTPKTSPPSPSKSLPSALLLSSPLSVILIVVVQPCRQPARSFLGISSAAGLSQVSFHQWCSD